MRIDLGEGDDPLGPPMSAPILGTLDWRPAADHPELLAPPVAAAIADAALDCHVAAIDPDLADTAAFCAAYEVAARTPRPTAWWWPGGAATSTMAACLVLATDRADVNKTVRKHLDVRKISFASMADAVAQTGMEYGGITPVGLPGGWPILVDEAAVAAAVGGDRQRHPRQQDPAARPGAGRAPQRPGPRPHPGRRPGRLR